MLCYAPYNRFRLPGLWETTILNGLKLRGAEVEYVLCDGLYTECDLWYPANGIERPANACGACQAEVAGFVTEMGLDFRWLGRHLMPEEGREAARWARSLPAERLLTERYGDWPVGEWIRGSVQSHFRASHLDPADPKVERVLRRYVHSGLVACFALDRLLQDSAPDVLLLFNGRMSSTRVALELARRHGIRVITHERGPRHQTLKMVENNNSISLADARRYWQEWGDVALSADELLEIGDVMIEREHGHNTNWTPYTPPPQPSEVVLTELGLAPGRPLWALFTTSDDETANEPEYASSFASQYDWVTRSIAYAAAHPEIDLVVRVHPNTGSRRSWGINRTQLEQMRGLAADLPSNVRIVDPESDLSSYSLMNLCSAGLIWASTVGVELACKGKQVVVAGGNPLRDTSFAHTVHDPDRYDDILDSLLHLAPGAVDPEIRRLALRLAYGVFLRLPVRFPLIQMPAVNEGRPVYASTAELAPGRDAGLDRATAIILDGAPVCPVPTLTHRGRDTKAEDAFLSGRDPRGTLVLAFADELIADADLLASWAETFGPRSDVTLLINTTAEQTSALVESVALAGLDEDDGPPLVAGEIDLETMRSVHAVFSRVDRADCPAPVRRYTPEVLGELGAATLTPEAVPC